MHVVRQARLGLQNAFDRMRLLGRSPVSRALAWARKAAAPGPQGGPTEHPPMLLMTQETAGYMIPTLYAYGEKALAQSIARWEASVQLPNGAQCAVDGVPYTFDTAQVIRGYLAVVDDMPEMERPLRKACDYVASMIAPNGEVLHESYDAWKLSEGGSLSEYGNLFALPPLLEAGRKLGEREYLRAGERAVKYFLSKPDLTTFHPSLSTLSHYFGYMMEALVDIGEREVAGKGLAQAEALQAEDGSIPAYPGARWVCSTGLAQLAVAWYKLGRRQPADKAMTYLEMLQNASGGFYGGYGPGAQYFPNQEIPWAVKFYLDAHQLRNHANATRVVPLFGS